MTEYGYAIDGMLYHISQAPMDERGRRVPLPGAQYGYILKASEFGEMPELTPEAQALVEMWRARQGTAVESAEMTPATPTHVATYHTKVAVPETPAADLRTKVEEAADDDEPAPSQDAPRSRPGGRS